MTNYTKYKRGSEWRRWDIHIHTPETKKNNHFEGTTAQEQWEKYIHSINCSTDDVSVIGITDYLSIDNYFKFKTLIEEGKITKQFDLVIPNIELRVLPVTKSSNPINLHCLFNPNIDFEIETRFLSKLSISYNGTSFSGHKNELIRLGRSMPTCSLLSDDDALQKGLEQYVISIDSLRSIFESDEKLRENTIIIVSNSSNDGVSGIRNHADYFTNTGDSQLDITRWSIYQFSDAIFSSNQKDILYFLGLGPDSKNLVIEKCKTIMPCFHGSDAHSNNKIFKPDGNRYCWIKADPTFEGLKQTLYEPKDRVRIQPHKPDLKNDRFIISELQFIDNGNLFGNHKILLNENLNAIIGGKSSGKSLLLHCIAKSIDPEQVDRTSKRLGFEGYKFSENFNFEVTWKNGDKNIMNDNHNKNNKIIHIPQLYINHLVEKDNRGDLNKLIENILIQDLSFKEFYQLKKQSIAKLTEDIDTEIIKYFQIRSNGLTQQSQLKDIGTSSAIAKSIESIQIQIVEVQKNSNFTKEELEAYNKILSDKSQLEEDRRILLEKETAASNILNELTNVKKGLFGYVDPTDFFSVKGKLFTILEGLSKEHEDLIQLVDKLLVQFNSFASNANEEIEKLRYNALLKELENKIIQNKTALAMYQPKLKEQNFLMTLTKNLEQEKNKLNQALHLEKQLETSRTEYNASRQRIAAYIKDRYRNYLEISEKIIQAKNNIGAEITLTCSIRYSTADFMLFDQANKAATAGANILYDLFTNETVRYDKVIELIEKPLRVADNKLIIDTEHHIPLKSKVTLDDVIRGLAKDCLSFDYVVTYKGDNLLNMSPGKKGTVLLILFLKISSSEYPILIDQPEDNLDNRTIYELLCKIIKEKKKERQIIIVSHNANLVVTTDAENIIVANQRGEEAGTINTSTRFQYVNGSLEHSFEKVQTITSELLNQGIREHVCDILEGGNEAFKQRERKYSIK